MYKNCGGKQSSAGVFMTRYPSAYFLLSRSPQHVDSCWIAIHHVLSCCLEGTKKWNRRVACYFQPIQLPSSNLFESPIQDFHLHLIGKNLVLWLHLAAKEVGKFRNFVTKEEAIGGIFWKTCPCFTNTVALEALF